MLGLFNLHFVSHKLSSHVVLLYRKQTYEIIILCGMNESMNYDGYDIIITITANLWFIY